MTQKMFQCSSASRKFLNQLRSTSYHITSSGFQCSSASRKFLNQYSGSSAITFRNAFQCSSASRKFLNRSALLQLWTTPLPFQCSSASRKFLNRTNGGGGESLSIGFSALQRAENSSILPAKSSCWFCPYVSVLFSEPKIPQ